MKYLFLIFVYFNFYNFAYAQVNPTGAQVDSISCGGRTYTGAKATRSIALNATSSAANHQTFYRNGVNYLTTATITCWCVRTQGTSGSAGYITIGHGTTAPVNGGAAPTGATYFLNGGSSVGSNSALGIEGQSTGLRKEHAVDYTIDSGKYPFIHNSAASQVLVEMLCY